ncbi:hypothetical protein [Nodosilinea sp. P-1105]|uniref:hypothetical protein n=1 Tax=Nodosilinea sp. P-1105 TaxID=2546229 RepID=UPI00146DE1C9|nr:hypothetical protein [Nodosilinea sp. P-1105]NMF82420.1 hypothetical protein [Nodosilinea sp. P-1105]
MTIRPEAKAYLIRLSMQQQQPLLGDYRQGCFYPNDYGQIVADEWVRSAQNRKGIDLDLWTLAPNGLRGVVFLQPALTRQPEGLAHQKPWLLSSFIASFKAAAAKRINLRRNQLGQPVWQSSYDEQLIADNALLDQVREQILRYNA